MYLGPRRALLRNAAAAAVGYDAAAEAIFAAFTTPPDDTRKGHINTLVLALKAGTNVWSKLDVLYVFAAAGIQEALINWKSPGTFNATAINSPTHTTDVGYTGNTSNQLIESNWNFSTNGVNYLQNSASLFVWLVNAGTGGAAVGGDGGFTDYIHQHWGPTTVQALANGAAFGNVSATSISDKTGLWCINRSGSTALQLYQNGASAGTGTTTSQAPANQELTFLTSQVTFYSDAQISCGGAGGSLDATEQDQLYDALAAYQSAI